MLHAETNKRELPYFTVDGKYGFDQEDFRDPWMRLGGCGAVTACDSCIYFDLYFGTHLYPYPLYKDEGGLQRRIGPTKQDYLGFSKLMKPYLRPRHTGINSLEIFIDGFSAYLQETGEKRFLMQALSGSAGAEEAKRKLRAQIDRRLPVPCLTLRHQDPVFDDFVWHWFLLTGYQVLRERFLVKAVSYGQWRWMDFDALWDTGYMEKGGLVLYHFHSA